MFHSQEGYFLRTRKDGLWVPVNLTVTRLHVQPQTLALITARDVRERHDAHARLERAEAELRQVLASVSGCIWSAEVDAGRWTYRYCSPVVANITGRPTEFFLEGPSCWGRAVHPEDRPRWDRWLAQLCSGQPGQEEYRVVWPDGTTRWVSDSVRVTRQDNGRALRLDGVLTDITERKQAEEQLKKVNTFLDSIVENVPIMLFVKDAETLRFELFNRAGERLLGYRREDMLGKNDYDFFPREEADFFIAKDREVLAGKKLVDIPEELIQTRDGLRILHTMKIPILDEHGDPRYLLGISEDITERKALEEARRRAAEEGDRMRSILFQTEKLASIGRLSAGVAHEINNPLAYVANNLCVLERDVRGLLRLLEVYEAAGKEFARAAPECACRARETAEEIDLPYIRENLDRLLGRTRDGLDRVTRIVHSLRAHARTAPAPRQEVDLAALLDASLEILQARLRARSIEVRKHYGACPKVQCTSTDLGQVFLNLLVNACQAIEVLPASQAGYIDVAIQREGDEVRIEVADNGCGIAVEDRPRLFDPFFTTKPVGEGTGLGLWITHAIVSAHGGRIEVDSQPGAGARFRIFLPASPCADGA